MIVPFRLAFDAGEAGVLPHLPIRVGAARPGIPGPVIEGGLAVVIGADSWHDRLDLREENPGTLLHRPAVHPRPDATTGVIHENTRCTRLGAGGLIAVSA